MTSGRDRVVGSEDRDGVFWSKMVERMRGGLATQAVARLVWRLAEREEGDNRSLSWDEVRLKVRFDKEGYRSLASVVRDSIKAGGVMLEDIVGPTVLRWEWGYGVDDRDGPDHRTFLRTMLDGKEVEQAVRDLDGWKREKGIWRSEVVIGQERFGGIEHLNLSFSGGMGGVEGETRPREDLATLFRTEPCPVRAFAVLADGAYFIYRNPALESQLAGHGGDWQDYERSYWGITS